ncbi:Kinesin, partial [Ascosphaera acerosa]
SAPTELKCKAPCLISMDPASQTTTIQHPDTLRHGHAASKQSLRGDDGARTFTFDRSLWSHDPDDPSYASQEDVYAALGEEFLDHNFEGYHTCIFAYGQTGAGKSYTMMGTPDQPGLIPRTCQDLFERIADGAEQHPHVTYAVRVSYFEVYNEHVRDLLAPGGSSGGSGGGGGAAGAGSTCYLKVRESPTDGPYVKDLTEIPVRSLPEIMRCIRKGDAARTTASTKMNDTSSRSHAVFTVTLKQIQHDLATDETTERTARIRLVDLAGSERAKATEATGERLREGSNINRSLATLGRVMKALATSSSSRPSSPSKQHRKAKDAVVPYRDSVLTYLLKDSLGGNSKTAMIACISPADYEETLSTLRYADQAKRIRTRAVVNQDHLSAAERDAQIAEMAETIRLLQLSLGRVSASAQVVAQQQQDSRLAIEREREREVQVERLEEYQSQVAKLQQLMEEKEMIAASKIRQLTTENEALRLHLKLAVESLKNPIPQVPVQGGDQVDAAYPEEDAEECDEDGGEGDENGAGGEWDDHTDADTAEQDDESDILEMQSQLQDLLDQVTFFKNKVQDDHERFGLRARDPKDESDITAMLDLTNDTDIASLGDVTVLCSDVGQATRDETLTAAPEPSRVETAAGEVFANA